MYGIVIYYVQQGEDSLCFWNLCPILLTSLVNKICSTIINCNNTNIYVNFLSDYTCFTAIEVQKYPAMKKANTYKFTAYSFWVNTGTYTCTIFKWFTQYEISNQCMLYSPCDVISIFLCSFFFFTHKLSNPIKVWHLKGLDNGNSYNTYMHVFFSALESVCYMYKIDYKVLTILKTNLYHLRINNIYVHVLKAKSLDHFQCF